MQAPDQMKLIKEQMAERIRSVMEDDDYEESEYEESDNDEYDDGEERDIWTGRVNRLMTKLQKTIIVLPQKDQDELWMMFMTKMGENRFAPDPRAGVKEQLAEKIQSLFDDDYDESDYEEDSDNIGEINIWGGRVIRLAKKLSGCFRVLSEEDAKELRTLFMTKLTSSDRCPDLSNLDLSTLI